jgi:hypothetical protein
VISGLSALGVLLFGAWHVSTRYENPLPSLDDPLNFLLLFGGLFIVAWLPMAFSLLRARALRQEGRKAETVDPTTALSVFDVTVVRGLVQHDVKQATNTARATTSKP